MGGGKPASFTETHALPPLLRETQQRRQSNLLAASQRRIIFRPPSTMRGDYMGGNMPVCTGFARHWISCPHRFAGCSFMFSRWRLAGTEEPRAYGRGSRNSSLADFSPPLCDWPLCACVCVCARARWPRSLCLRHIRDGDSVAVTPAPGKWVL